MPLQPAACLFSHCCAKRKRAESRLKGRLPGQHAEPPGKLPPAPGTLLQQSCTARALSGLACKALALAE